MPEADIAEATEPQNLSQGDIAKKLQGIERYNPLHIDILTEYLESQCKNNTYDQEANSAILKLIQFSPSLFKSEVVEKILLKALTNLPHPDFILYELLIDPSILSQGNIQDIIQMHERLELCQFRQFWEDLRGQKDIFKDIVGFEDSIREFVCYTVGITYQNVRASLLKDLLGLSDDEKAFKECLERKNWKLNDDGYVTVENQEDKIKTINITEKIELEQVANVLATYR